MTANTFQMELWSPRLVDFYDPLMAGSIDGTDSVPHDHGIVRAIECNYKPNNSVAGEADKTIFVSRLDWDTSESTLRSVFSRYGPIRNIRLVRDLVTGFSKGYAFIEYEEEQYAVNAYRYGDRTSIDGRGVFVDFECERNLPGWVPRRLGGGFGGKKESGQLRFGGRDRPFRKPLLPNVRVYNEQYDRNPYKQRKTDNTGDEPDATATSSESFRDRENASYRRSRSRCSARKSDRTENRSSRRYDDERSYSSRSKNRDDDGSKYHSGSSRSDYDRRDYHGSGSNKHSSRRRSSDRSPSHRHSLGNRHSRYRGDRSRSPPSGHHGSKT